MLGYEADDGFVVPQEQGALCHLKMRICDAARQLTKQRLQHQLELCRLRDLQNLLQLTQEQHLFLAVDEGPEAQQCADDVVCQLRLLLHKLSHAVCQLLVVHCDALGLVQRHQCPRQKALVFFLERQSKAIDDGAQNLKELSDAIVSLRLEYEPVKHIVDRLPDEGPVHHELAIDAMKHGLQVVTFPGVLAVKELENFHHKHLIHVLFGGLGIGVLAHHVAQQELVHDLQVRPGELHGRLFLVRVPAVSLRTPPRRQ
mmetsp:Transcript_10154/g.30487  ORF Transcript_10154/g.30487 Transcript_10154/m.30487 type:complete len:257 (-) Transcript_10154:1169-1939(-)